ncbi:hypothetical protein QWY99_11820 [Flavobacterium branchiarum]|nr:hypothetical protein [Flavobacterium branchiarum]MDN3673744.1 hypothetical protein [Flavobacterium branchiarum]
MFGSSGDLAKRKLFPAFQNLSSMAVCQKNFRLLLRKS